MSFAESTIFFGLHAIRMCLFILRHVVVPLFTFCTCQCNLCAHDFHLHLNFRCFSVSSFSALCFAGLRQNLSIKKRPKLFHSPYHYSITMSMRQSFSLFFCRKSACFRGFSGFFHIFSMFLPFFQLISHHRYR